MKTTKQTVSIALALAALTMGMAGPSRAEDAGKAKSGSALGSLWAVPKEDGKLSLLLAGQPDPISVAVSDQTLLAGICQDCGLPLEFKPGESAKKCNVCGCGASNAACIAGKPMKDGGWQGMVKGLPRGVGLRPTFNIPDKPESGLKKLAVDFRSVFLPVTGLDSVTPGQLLALVKPLGGNLVETVDSGKRLSIHLKSDWTIEREVKLEAALAKLNAKVVMPEEPKLSQ